LEKMGCEERGDMAKSAYWRSDDAKSLNEWERPDKKSGDVPLRARLMAGEGTSMSCRPKLKAPKSRCGCSAWTSGASGVDSSDDDEDSSACRLGEAGAMESAAISSMGI